MRPREFADHLDRADVRASRAVAEANLKAGLNRALYLANTGDVEGAANVVRQLAQSLPPPEVKS